MQEKPNQQIKDNTDLVSLLDDCIASANVAKEALASKLFFILVNRI